MRIFFVAPDYHEGKAKKCVNGWGSMFLTVTPDGTALPCHTAKMLPGLAFPNVRDMPLREIWYDRGLQPLPRHRLDEGALRQLRTRRKDLGGCRCQAYLLAQDAEAADPVCRKSPHHGQVLAAVAQAEAEARTRVTEHPLVFRDPKESRRLAEAASAAQRDCT
jgi:pyrroloquinoline quinone biosynthesis protein E